MLHCIDLILNEKFLHNNTLIPSCNHYYLPFCGNLHIQLLFQGLTEFTTPRKSHHDSCMIPSIVLGYRRHISTIWLLKNIPLSILVSCVWYLLHIFNTLIRFTQSSPSICFNLLIINWTYGWMYLLDLVLINKNCATAWWNIYTLSSSNNSAYYPPPYLDQMICC